LLFGGTIGIVIGFVLNHIQSRLKTLSYQTFLSDGLESICNVDAMFGETPALTFWLLKGRGEDSRFTLMICKLTVFFFFGKVYLY